MEGITAAQRLLDQAGEQFRALQEDPCRERASDLLATCYQLEGAMAVLARHQAKR